ncbi:hypothetical protein BH11MYX4_BH11MYX4_28740 [soil metagenome]
MTPKKPQVLVARRNLRWEVAVGGLTRPRIDWLCTRERAVEHALELARELATLEGRAVLVAVMPTPGEQTEELMVEAERVA